MGYFNGFPTVNQKSLVFNRAVQVLVIFGLFPVFLGLTGCTKQFYTLNTSPATVATPTPHPRVITVNEEFSLFVERAVMRPVPLPIDLLFVIDTSGSMGQFQQALAQASDDLLNSTFMQNVKNLQITSIATDTFLAGNTLQVPEFGINTVYPDSFRCNLASFYLNTQVPGIPYVAFPFTGSIDPNTTSVLKYTGTISNNFSDQFKLLMRPGTSGWGVENPLASLLVHLEGEKTPNCGTGSPTYQKIWRQGSLKMLLLISDEEGVSFDWIQQNRAPTANTLTKAVAYTKSELDTYFKTLSGKANDPFYAVLSAYNGKNDPHPTDPAYAFRNDLNAIEHKKLSELVQKDPANSAATYSEAIAMTNAAGVVSTTWSKKLFDKVKTTIDQAAKEKALVRAFPLREVPAGGLSSLHVTLRSLSHKEWVIEVPHSAVSLSGTELQILESFFDQLTDIPEDAVVSVSFEKMEF